MTILVTGGTGFIGSHLAERLLERGEKVRVLAMNEPIDQIELENAAMLREKGVEIFHGDLRDKGSLEKAVKDTIVVFHLGAISRPMKIPKEIYYDVNRDGTRNLLEVCRDKNLEKFVHVSTVSTLGVSADGRPLKEDEFQDLTDDYGLSKKEGEKIALEYHREHRLPVVVVRPPLTYGPRCMVRLIMFKYTQKRIFPLFNKGKSRMEFCYVDNLVQAILKAESTPNVLGEVFNISDGQSYEIGEIIRGIANAQGVKGPLLSNMPIWLGKVLGFGTEILSKIVGIHPPFSRITAQWMSEDQNVYDISKAKRVLNYSPEVSLEEGLKKTVDWYRERGSLKA